MTIVNEKVEHISFGEGVVAELNDNKIFIRFLDNIGTKIFIYPDAFEKFLKAVNPDIEKYVMEDCRKRQELIIKEQEHIIKESEAAELEEKKEKLELKKKKSSARSRKKA